MKKLFTLLAVLLVAAAANAQTDLIISEYGEGWGSNKYLEIYNPTNSDINLKDYKIVRFSNGGQTVKDDYSVQLPDVSLEPYKAFVVTQDKRESAGTVGDGDSPIWSQLEARGDFFANSAYGTGPGTKCIHWNGNDAVVLFKGADIVDIFGQVGINPAPASIPGSSDKIKAWTDTPNYDDGKGIGLSADHSLVRKSSVKDGVVLNPDGFNILAEYDTFPANTFINLGWHKFDGAPANTIPVINMDTLYAVSPLAEEGDLALTLTATDPDADQNLEFYIVSGNFVYIGEGDDAKRHEPFTLDKTTGKITVADELAIADAKDDIYFNVVACDEYGQSEIFSFDIRITDEASISETKVIKTKLFPNPAKEQFSITAAEVIKEVRVYSLTGQEMYSQLANAKKVEVAAELSAGSYIVKTAFANAQVGIDKLIVE